MNKKFELLREAVNTYKVNHCDGNKNEKELLEFIDELEQLNLASIDNQRELLCENSCHRSMTMPSRDAKCPDCGKPW